MPKRFKLLVLLAGFLLCVSGCQDHTPVRTYTVEAEPSPRVLQIEAALVVVDDDAWFFKADGSPELIQPHREEMIAFLQSVQFGGDKGMDYDLPEDWLLVSQDPNSTGAPGSMAFAEIAMSKSQLTPKLVITRLALNFASESEHRQADEDAYVLQNVNRWRRQVALPPLAGAAVGLPGESFQTRDGQAGLLFSMVGQFDPASRQPPAPAQFTFDTENFELPAGWSEAENDQFSKAAFDAGSGIRVTVTPVGGTGDTFQMISSNIERWQRQLGLPPAESAEEAAEVTSRREVDGHVTIVVNLSSTGPTIDASGTESQGPTSIVGALVVADGSLWAFKMKGPATAVQAKLPDFNRFLDSVKIKPDPRKL